MKNQTYVDSLAIRIDIASPPEQQQLLDNIIRLCKSYNLPFKASPKNGNWNVPYKLDNYQSNKNLIF